MMKLESVQKQFLIFALKSLPWNSTINLPPYQSRLNLFSPFLLNKININVPLRRGRYYSLLLVNYHKVNYLNQAAFRMACIDFNDCCSVIDFEDSLVSLKLKLLNYFRSSNL